MLKRNHGNGGSPPIREWLQRGPCCSLTRSAGPAAGQALLAASLRGGGGSRAVGSADGHASLHSLVCDSLVTRADV